MLIKQSKRENKEFINIGAFCYGRSFRYVVFGLCVSALVACGGGGTESSSSGATVSVADETTNDVPVNNNDTTVNNPPSIASTADLIVPDNFSFASDSLLSVEFNFPRGKDSLYLSLCHPIDAALTATSEIDYDNCLLRTWLKPQRLVGDFFQQDVQLMSHIDGLVAVVFDPELMQESSYYWSREQGMQFLLQ